MNQQEQLFTIQQVSAKLNIPKPTLRFWEKELDGIIVPHRTRGGQRRYALEHLAIIGKVKELREKGMSLAEIKRQINNINKLQNDNTDFDRVDLLAERVAEVVKVEVNRFFEWEAE
jgi:DNA-binding transcriptional MerR regulator